MAAPLLANHIHQGPHTFYTPGAGEDVDIYPNQRFAIGYIHARAMHNADIVHGDRLWYTLPGAYGTRPNIPVYTSYSGNRNFGAPNAARRSNLTSIGQMDTRLYSTIWRNANPNNRYGPAVGQAKRRRVNVKVINPNPIQGWLRDVKPVKVVAYWN